MESKKADYKKGDRISFELRDMNNTLIPLSIENATFAGLPLSFYCWNFRRSNFSREQVAH